MLIPKNKIVVFTGVSGSGKSSLLFSTIYEEARARYLEALLPNAFRTFRLKRPDVDYIHGLLPPIAIEQKTSANLNPRSTVGTSTEVLTFLRMLFARVGERQKRVDEQLTPAMFSFNTPHGMCGSCNGLGEIMSFDLDLIIPDQKRSMRDILNKATRGTFTPLEKSIEALARRESFDLDAPFERLSKEAQRWILRGYEKDIVVDYVFKTSTARRHKQYPGIIPFLEESYKTTTSLDRRKRIEKYMSFSQCPACRGARLNERALSILIERRSIDDLVSMPVVELHDFLTGLRLEGERARLARELIREILERLKPIKEVGLGYLTLKRSSPTLSAGELQRLSLAKHLGSGLGGLLYILDEPTTGLHFADVDKLLRILHRLVEVGNSVLVVEHNLSVIRTADYIIDLGPGGGRSGGEVVACGTPEIIAASQASLTGKFLRKGELH